MTRGRHIHKYRRARLGKSIIYKCVMPGCSHFIQKSLIEGRVSVCWRCPNPFVITQLTLRNCPAKPHCENCYKRTDKDLMVDAALDELIK